MSFPDLIGESLKDCRKRQSFFVQEVSMLYFDLNDGKGVLFTDLTRIFERLVGEKTAFRVRSS